MAELEAEISRGRGAIEDALVIEPAEPEAEPDWPRPSPSWRRPSPNWPTEPSRSREIGTEPRGRSAADALDRAAAPPRLPAPAGRRTSARGAHAALTEAAGAAGACASPRVG